MTLEQVKRDIQWLYGKLSARDQKYLRNLNRFVSNGNRREGIRTIYTNPQSFYTAATDSDTGILPAINVGRSMALTLQSKLIQTKGRIFFDGVNSNWETLKLIRNAQVYFDAVVDVDKTYQKIRQSVLDALVFDLGVIHVDAENKRTERIRPWEFYVDPAELNYGRVSRCYIQQDDYPLINLSDKLKKGTEKRRELDENRQAKVKYYRYFDLIDLRRYEFADSELIGETKLESDRMPFALFYYNEPVKGLYSTSVIDNVYQNQRQIDDILIRVHDALTLSPANTIYVPDSAQGANVAKMISNKVGNVVPYNAAAGSVVVATPPPIDPSYLQHLQFFITQSFETEGISQLSAQSKKPSGVNSGVALDTLQDVESERFQAVVDQLIEFQKEIYDIMIACYPGGDEILPKGRGRANIKWREIKANREKYTLQSSLASVLSKDPKVKMEQVEKLQAQGVIPAYMVPMLLQIPDIDRAYSAATASYDNCQKIIERALDNDEYSFYNIVDLTQLMTVAVNTLMQLDSVDEDPAILARLANLIAVIVQKQNEKDGIMNPNAPPIPAKILDSGAMIESVVLVAQAVQSGALTPEAAAQIIAASGVPIEQARIIIGVNPQPVPGTESLNEGGVA